MNEEKAKAELFAEQIDLKKDCFEQVVMTIESAMQYAADAERDAAVDCVCRSVEIAEMGRNDGRFGDTETAVQIAALGAYGACLISLPYWGRIAKWNEEENVHREVTKTYPEHPIRASLMGLKAVKSSVGIDGNVTQGEAEDVITEAFSNAKRNS